MMRSTFFCFLFFIVFSFICIDGIDLLGHRSWQFWMKTRENSGGVRNEGVSLHTRVVVPRKFVDDGSETYSVVIDRSPYGYSGLEWIADLMVPFGFVAIGQDMRGTGYSAGNFSMWMSDNYDGEDLGNWIVSQPWSNGKVYTFGASADGIASMTIPHNKPSWLAGQYVVVSSSEAYEILFPNGAYLYHLIQWWLAGTVRPKDQDYTFQTLWENEAKTPWWQPLDMAGHYNEYIQFPSGFWAGWYDIFLPGTLMTYDGYNYNAIEGFQEQSRLFIDPLGHCQTAAEFFPQHLVGGRSLLGIAQMLETYGIRPVSRKDIKKVTFYVMSSNDDIGLSVGNYWTSLDSFPKPTTTPLYLNADGTASYKAPASDSDDALSTTYTYDPSNPVMGYGGNNLSPLECGPLEQGPSEAGRTDVLQFDLPASDESVYMTGPLNAKLWVSSDAIDTDFTAKLSDVYPTGEIRLIQDAAFRMRWRNQDENNLDPMPMSKGEIYNIDMTLWNTSYILAPGHLLRVSISSSNYPRFSVNANNMVLLADETYPGVNITAQNTLYHSSQYPSHIELPIVNVNDLPEHKNIEDTVFEMYPQLKEFDNEKLNKFMKGVGLMNKL